MDHLTTCSFNHDHIDEGDRVKGDRGWEKGEGGRMERGGRKMRETGDKAKRKKGGEGVFPSQSRN
jgi:hypothetical protein